MGYIFKVYKIDLAKDNQTKHMYDFLYYKKTSVGHCGINFGLVKDCIYNFAKSMSHR